MMGSRGCLIGAKYFRRDGIFYKKTHDKLSRWFLVLGGGALWTLLVLGWPTWDENQSTGGIHADKERQLK